jgi:hypothetical protein
MDRRPWHLVDPGATLREIESLCPFQLDAVIVPAVGLDTQRVTNARVATVGNLPDDHHEASVVVRRLAEQMVPERWASGGQGHGITHVLVTVVCREGRVTFTGREGSWFRAWGYANHFRAAFDGDVYIVTPHGWGGVLDDRGGLEPYLGIPTAVGSS